MKNPFKSIVQRHQSVSDSIFGVFQKTLSKLQKEEESINNDIDAEQAKIDKAIDTKSSLEAIKQKNSVFMEKLAKFIGE